MYIYLIRVLSIAFIGVNGLSANGQGNEDNGGQRSLDANFSSNAQGSRYGDASVIVNFFLTNIQGKHGYESTSVNPTFSPIRMRRSGKEGAPIVLNLFPEDVQEKQAVYKKQRSINECTSRECQDLVEDLQSSMDFTVNPCDDFYKFACGNYAKTKVFQRNEHLFGILDEQVQLAQDKYLKLVKSPNHNSKLLYEMNKYYKTCLAADETKNIAYIRKIFDEVGGWPVVIGETWNEKNFDFLSVYKHLKKHYFSVKFPVETVWTYTPSSKMKFTISIHLSSNKIGVASYPIKNYNECLDRMIKLAVEFGADPAVAKKDMNDILQFDMRLAKIRRKVTNADGVLYGSEIDVRNYLNIHFPEIPQWNETLTDVRESMNKAFGLKLTPRRVFVKIQYPLDEYFKLVLADTPKRVQANYMFVSSLLSMYEFIKVHPSIREQFCLKQLLTTFKRITRFIYSKSFISPESFQIARNITENLKAQYPLELQKLNFSDKKVKKVDNYLKALKVVYGHDVSPEDQNSFEEFYADLDVSGSSFYEVQKRVNDFLKKEKNRTLLSDEDAKNLEYLGFNCFFNKIFKRIVYSATSMEEPYLSPNYPASINYGRFGFIAGHEMGHGLLQFGPLRGTPRTMNNIKCVIRQYGNVRAYENMALNGELTKDENMPDIAGIHVAYNAYIAEISRKGFSDLTLPDFNYNPRQLFWISAASAFCLKINKRRAREALDILLKDVHTPFHLRFNPLFQNMLEFSKDFQCQPGSPMNPQEKCRALRK